MADPGDDAPDTVDPLERLAARVDIDAAISQSVAWEEVLSPAARPRAGVPAPPLASESTRGPRPGRRFGRYDLLDVLGKGGFGVVYRAHDTQLGRMVALKVLERLSERARARFDREVRLAARLRHPNIVAVHDAGTCEDRPFLVMELVRGKTLDELAGTNGMSWLRAAALLRDVARAVHHAHENGILHRDIKPQNVLVDERGTPVVLDFGLAQEAELDGTRSVIGGTPAYMSPEQAGERGLTVGPATDVWGLGATLYHALTGHAPFGGQTPEQVLVSVLRRTPPRPGELVPDVPPELDELCLRCLKKSPADRWPSAAQLADALDGLVALHESTPSSRALRAVARLPGSAYQAIGAGPGQRVRLAIPLLGALLGGAIAWALFGDLTGSDLPEQHPPLRTPPPAREPAAIALTADPRERPVVDQLLAGVESIELVGDDGPFAPGVVCLAGEGAWPVLTGATEAEEEAWVAAAVHGAGRVVALAHSSFLDADVLQARRGVARLVENATRWAAGGLPPRKVGVLPSWKWAYPPDRPPGFVRPPRPGSALLDDLALVAWFQARGHEVTYLGEDDPELLGLDLVVWTESHLPATLADRLEGWVRKGGGLIAAICPWEAQEALGEQVPLPTLSWHRVLGPMGLWFSPQGRLQARAGQDRVPVRTVAGVHAGRVLRALELEPDGRVGPEMRHALLRAARSAPVDHELACGAKALAQHARLPGDLARQLEEACAH